MIENNEIRRTKIKLAMLHDKEALNWLLFDLIDLIYDINEYGDKAIVTNEKKMMMIATLKTTYKRIIEDNSPKDKKQQKLF